MDFVFPGNRSLLRSVFVLCGFLLFFSLPSYSTCSKLTQKELSTSQIEKLFQKYTKLTSFKTHFTQRKWISDINIQLTSSGTLIVKRPSEIIWEVEEPTSLKLILKEKKLFITQFLGKQKKEKVWDLSSPKKDNPEEAGIEEFLIWLNLDMKEIQNRYLVFSEPKHEKSQFCFLPKNKKTIPQKEKTQWMKIKLHPQGFLEEIKWKEISQDELSITFSKPIAL